MDDIIEELKHSNNIAIAFHNSPDGDCIGCMFAMKNALEQLNKNVEVIIHSAIPYKYGKIIDKQYIETIISPTKFYDLIIVLDCSSKERTFKELNFSSNKIISIDHHISNSMFGDINLVDTEVISTGIILYRLFKKMGIMNEYIANMLYLSICGDSQFFSNQVDSETHQIVSELLKYDIKFNEIKEALNSKSKKFMIFLGHALQNLKYKNNIVFSMITNKDIKKYDMFHYDIYNVIDYIKDISNCTTSLLFIEYKDGIHISARSIDNDIDLSVIMEKFNGGGHKHAAGGIIKNCPIQNAANLVIEQINSCLK